MEPDLKLKVPIWVNKKWPEKSLNLQTKSKAGLKV